MAKTNVVLEMSGDEKRLVRALTRSEKEIDKLKGKLKETGEASKKAGKQSEGAFGGKALGNIKSMAAGVLSVGAAIRLATAALTKFEQVSDQAGKRIETAAQGRRALSQVSEDAKEFARLNARVEQSRRLGLGEVEAFNLVFQAKSADKSLTTPENIAFFTRLREIGFDPSAGVASVQKLQQNFGGAGAGTTGAGTPRQIINKLLTAVGGSPAKATEFSSALSTAATSFADIGGQDEALLAFGSVLSKALKSPEAGVQLIKSLSDQLIKKTRQIVVPEGETLPKGLELIFALPGLAAAGRLRGAGGKKKLSANEFLGESSAIIGLSQAVKNESEIRALLSDIQKSELQTGTDQGKLRQRTGIVQNDPTLAAITAKEQQVERRKLAEENRFGNVEILADALQQNLVAEIRERGLGAFRSFAKEKLLDLRRFAAGPTTFLEEFNQFNTDPDFKLQIDKMLQIAAAVKEAADAQKAAADRMDAFTDRMDQILRDSARGGGFVPATEDR